MEYSIQNMLQKSTQSAPGPCFSIPQCYLLTIYYHYLVICTLVCYLLTAYMGGHEVAFTP